MAAKISVKVDKVKSERRKRRPKLFEKTEQIQLSNQCKCFRNTYV